MSNFNSTNFRLYAKFNDQKTFKALDIQKGTQVNNLIFATIFSVNELDKVKELIKLNENVCFFQIRDINNKIVFK